MSKVITFSRVFPAYHPKAGQPTFFVEKIYEGMMKMKIPQPEWNDDFIKWAYANLAINIYDTKYHTIRAGNRWKAGDKFSPRVWGNDINPKSGKSGPYHSKQIIIAPDIEIKKIWEVAISTSFTDEASMLIRIENKILGPDSVAFLAQNDGLTTEELFYWFWGKKDNIFKGQIICWNENINY